MDIYEKLASIVNKFLDEYLITKQDYNMDFTDFGIDSINFINIIILIESEFDIEVSDELLIVSELNSIKALAKAVKQLSKK